MWDAFKEGIFQFLVLIEGYAGDWGLAIIILTIIFRLAVWPLTVKQTRSAVEMQRVQPLVKEIQNKYADDKEKQQEELLKFYQEHKVNPFGGCLPMILQMPIFIALYQVLGGTPKEPGLMGQYFADNGIAGHLYGLVPNLLTTPKAGFEEGLLTAVPYVILLLLFGLSIWLPQALMPGEKSQKMIGLYMGVFMLVVGWSVPAGVLLYWDVSALVGLGQQRLTQRALKKAHEAESDEIVIENPQAKSSKAKGPKATLPKGKSGKSSK